MTRKNGKQKLDRGVDIAHNEEDDLIFDDLTDDIPLAEKLKKIKEELRACQQERKEYLDGWQRAKADFINTRKRDEENRVSSVKTAKEDLVLSLLPVLDSFAMAFGNKEALRSLPSDWVAGMQNIQNQMLAILKEHGVVSFNPTGEAFDANKHDSVEIRETREKEEDGKVLETVQQGYMADTKILRPAKVVVGEYKELDNN